jgi:hypothetical protein
MRLAISAGPAPMRLSGPFGIPKAEEAIVNRLIDTSYKVRMMRIRGEVDFQRTASRDKQTPLPEKFLSFSALFSHQV